LVKGIYELWGQGTDYEELEQSIKQYPEDRRLPYLTDDSTFKIVVDSFGKVISSQEQNERIHGLSYIPFKVSLIRICSLSVTALQVAHY
jgi:tRNA (guanine10-N2)-methyltransferase